MSHTVVHSNAYHTCDYLHNILTRLKPHNVKRGGGYQEGDVFTSSAMMEQD
jgi:hypothetical protein